MEGSGQHSFICSFLHSFILSHTHEAQNLLCATKDTGMGKWCLPSHSSSGGGRQSQHHSLATLWEPCGGGEGMRRLELMKVRMGQWRWTE